MQLLITDTVGIQGYVFGSNRLRENVGASYLVAQASGPWALQALRTATKGHCNIGPDDAYDTDWQIEDQPDGAELIYCGGGNVLGLFHGDTGDAFLRTLSTRLIEQAPGLELVAARIEFDFDKDKLRDGLDALQRMLAREKSSRPRRLPLAGLGVNRTCQSTGLPAIGTFERKVKGEPTQQRAASAEILAKLAVTNPGAGNASPAEERLYAIAGDSLPPEFRFPREIEHLGRTSGENSYIAVVHADGNGMGDRLREVTRRPDLDGDNRGQIGALRHFSRAVNQAGENALRATLEKLISCTEPDENGGRSIRHPDSDSSDLRIDLSKDPAEKNTWYLPLRPLVFGGDDVSFVCDGRIGLSLAHEYLEQFAAQSSSFPDGHISACAGIAIAKSGHPFSRTYALAEDLCRSAKQYRRDNNSAASCLDWHFTTAAAGESIEAVRERGYRTSSGDPLHLRPVELTGEPINQGRTWETVAGALRSFQGESWRKRRNKVKALRESLRQGDADVIRWFRAKYLDGGDGGKLPELPSGLGNWPEDGWHGGLCGYFDAIELMDHFIPLEPPEES